MEAVPRLPMLSFDLKGSHENASFGPKLKQYIADFYREDPESYNNEIHQLEGLRSAAVRPALDLTGCAALKRYFCQLRSLQSRFPMNKGQPAAVTFAWKDLFANIVCTLADVRFEMVCVLYNIGALHCKLGAAETRTTPDSMKAACTHFQSAVWAFQHLRENYPQPAGIDLSPEVMKLFQDICLAQAQECILEKSMQDNRKPSIVGAIGMQVLNYYKSALSALESSQSADNFQENVGTKICNSWIKYLSFKVSYIHCVVHLFQGMQSEEQQRMGERVAFYQTACDKLQEARKLSKGLAQIEAINETLTFTNDIVEGKRKAAKNENEFIYHEEVPDKDLLTEPKPASLAKGIPVNFNDTEVSGPDIFSRLVPMGAHEASSMYSEEKAKLLRKIISAVDMKDAQLNDFMSSLQLDQLNVLDEPESLPQDLIDRCASLSVRTDAIPNLVQTMNNLADTHTEVEDMLTDIRKFIQDEEKNEKEYQQIMGPRPPSNMSTELSREANKYLEAHNKANESNQTLHKAMTLHLANLKVLVLPLKEIEAHVPSLDSIRDNVDKGSIAEMRTLVAKVNEMQSQRKMLINMLRESVNADDITSQLLTRTGESLDEIFKQEIEKHNKQVGLIEQNMLAQENILKALTDAYAKYAPTRKLISDVLRKRETSVTALTTSYDTYEDLLNKSLKGLEFYSKLSANVSKLLTRVKSTCKVQEEERTQLLAKNPSKQVHGTSKSTNEINNPPQTPNVPVSSGPKLKDFLPYMKNRSSASYQAGVDANISESYSGQMYPPYVRPAPVGSEGTSDTQSSSYQDTSVSNPQLYPVDSEGYKGYQYIQQATGQYTQHYPDPTLQYQYSNYENSINKPDLSMSQNPNYHYYQQYNASNISDNINTSLKNPYKIESLKINWPQTSPLTNIQHPVPPYPQYDPSTTPQPPVSSNTATHDNYTANQNLNQTINQPHLPQNMIASNQYTVQNFQNFPSYNTENSSNENMTSMMYGPDLSRQMQNMNISYPTQDNNTFNPSSNSNLSYPSVSQPHDSVSNPSGNMSTQNVYSTANIPSDSYIPNYQLYASNSSFIPPNNAMYPIPADKQSTSTLSYGNSPVPVLNTGVLSTNCINQSNLNQDMGMTFNSSSQYSYNMYQTSQSMAQPNPLASQSFSTASTDNLPSSNLSSVSYPNYSGYANSYQPPNSQDYTQNKQESGDIPPIQSHVQGQYYQSNVHAEIPQAQMLSQYSTPNFYNQQNPSLEASGNNVPLVQNDTSQQYPKVDSSSSFANQPQNSSYQNHPGYTYNAQTGSYDYSYGYQNMSTNQSHVTYASNENPEQHNLYTNAGTYGTVQTQSATFDQSGVIQSTSESINNSQYYSIPYGHQSVGSMSSSTDQPTTPLENVVIPEQHTNYSNHTTLTYMNSNDTKTTTTNSVAGNNGTKSHSSEDKPKESDSVEPEEPKKEFSTMDLLSGLDFTVEQKPLMPEIKVPPVSEHVIRKAPSQEEYKKINFEQTESVIDSEESFERPPKRDIFSDPSLLNKFTQEVKNLQLFVDGFTKKTHSGITMLDSKWKKIQESQAKENSLKSTKYAKDNIGKNASPDVIPYDATRVVLKSDKEDDYINASHVKQISSWSIPMIMSDLPIEENYKNFWLLVYQQRVAVIVCLLTEIELQGKFYGPMTKNHKLELSTDLSVTLVDVNCNVNWTERKLIIDYENNQHKIAHYQINVFPARIVSAPLVLLVDQVLKTQDENNKSESLPKTLVHCSTGAGRSALIVFLMMVMCQVRAGFVDLRDMLDSGFLYLCGTRTNVLEDTKYLVDIYRTVLFYVQGVLCSGTVMFNGEAVSVPSGASVPPPHIPINPRKTSGENLNKFSKESFEEMKQAAGLKSGDMKDPLSYLDPLWSLKKRKE